MRNLIIIISLFAIILSTSDSFGQKDTPCECAQRWKSGASWNSNGTIMEFPASNHKAMQGVVSCHPSAQTQSDIKSLGCVYNSSQFRIDLSGRKCINPQSGKAASVIPPANGCPVIWLNFDFRGGAATYDYQLVAGSLNMGWALYYSSQNQNGVNSSGLSGNCSSLVLWQCGVTFNGWATMTAPPSRQTKNFYLAMWDMNCSKPSSYKVSKFGLNAFKARNGCSNFTCPVISPSFTKTDVTCSGSCDGRASVTATGGQAPYSFAWSNGNSNASLQGLCPNQYSVTITDANNCSASGTVSINFIPMQLALSSISETCAGSCNGSATALAIGGTAPYQYMWGIEGGEGATISGHCAGDYSITVTDAAGCEVKGTVEISSGACKMSGDEAETPFSGKPSSIKTYPNPFSESATLEFSVNKIQNVKAEVVTVDGRKVMTVFEGVASNDTKYSFKISRNDFVPGMYFFTVTGEGGTKHVSKFFITK